MNRHLIYTAFACMLIMLAVSCDDDCPTCPPPPTDPVSDYDIYLHGLVEAPIYVYNTKEMAVVDTLDLGDVEGVHDMALSGDGQQLIIALHNNQLAATVVLDINTFDTVEVLPLGTFLDVSKTGKYLAIRDVQNLYIYECETYSLVIVDVAEYNDGQFACDESKYYTVGDGSDIRIYDMAKQGLDTVLQYIDNDGLSPELYHIQPNCDGSKLYLTAGYYMADFLVAYSLENCSTTCKYRIGVPGGDLQITPDGNQVVFTDPGNIFFDQPGSMHVIFIDSQTDGIISIVDAGHSLMSETSNGFPPGLMAFTPDSRYTFIACSFGGPAYGMIDNYQHQFVDISVFEIQSVVMATVQKQLE